VDFVGRWSEKTGIALCVLVLWLGISLSKVSVHFENWSLRQIGNRIAFPV